MAAQLSFVRKTDGKSVTGRELNDLDDEMCKAFGTEPDPVKYFAYWMDTVGFSLAVTNSYEKAREAWGDDPDKAKVIDYLEEHYTPASHYTR